MSRNDHHLVGYPGKIGLRCPNHPVDAAARGVIDKRKVAVPPRVAGKKNVGFLEMRRNVRVCMGRWIMLERNRGAVDMNGMFVAENLSGNRAGWRLWKGACACFRAQESSRPPRAATRSRPCDRSASEC